MLKKDKERAIELLTLAAENGNEYAQYFLDHIDDIKEVPLSMMTTRMFRHIGRIIENELPIRNTILTGVEHKLKQKLIRKRSATGHRKMIIHFVFNLKKKVKDMKDKIKSITHIQKDESMKVKSIKGKKQNKKKKARRHQ